MQLLKLAAMSFNRRLSPLQLLFAAALFLAAAEMKSLAQDTIRQTSGVVQKGTITRMAKGAVVIKIGAGEIGIPLAQIAEVTKPAPAAVVSGLALQEEGKSAQALPLLKPVVDQFGGLPIAWAKDAAAALGDLYLSQNKMTEAAAAYQNYRTLYPDGGMSLGADVGMARIAAASNKPEIALKTLEPLLATGLAKSDLTKAESAAFGQACFTLGNIAEKQGNFADALQNYLRTVTIFYADRATVARAQERADALRKEHQIAVP